MAGYADIMLPKLIYVLLAVSITLTAACHAGDLQLLNKIKSNNASLTLVNDKGTCAIEAGLLNKQRLDIPWPCGFVRSDKAMVVQSHHYTAVGQVFIIAGPPADKLEYQQNTGVTPDHMCSNYGQAIIYQKEKLTLRKAQNIPLGFCHQLGFDEKDYYGYAYPAE